MIGAIAGDIIGSIYEWENTHWINFDPLFGDRCTFTDDTVLTIAVAEAIIDKTDYSESLRKWGRKYPDAGFGGNFNKWLFSDTMGAYDSWGNGSAMRISPVGFAFEDPVELALQATKCTEITHNHPEGMKGALCVAMVINLAQKKWTKAAIKSYVEFIYGYDLNRTVEEIRPLYQFDVSCKGTVPEAIICFLESTDFENAIRTAISLGGDSDTLTCITGGIAQAFYGEVPAHIVEGVRQRLPEDMLSVLDRFNEFAY